jgi:hypothetical protein
LRAKERFAAKKARRTPYELGVPEEWPAEALDPDERPDDALRADDAVQDRA